MGALAGFAGGIASYLGNYAIAPSAGYIFGNVASAAVSKEDLGKAALLGFIDSSVGATVGLFMSMPKIGEQGTPQPGDLIFYQSGLLDPIGLFLTYLQGAPVSHVAIAVSGSRQVDSHVQGGVKDRSIRTNLQGRIVKWSGSGNKQFVALATQYGKDNTIKYWLGPNREICSTFVGRVAKESGLSTPGLSPASQYNNLYGAQEQ